MSDRPAAALLKCLSDDVSLEILERLFDGPITQQQLLEELADRPAPPSPATVSRRMGMLASAGLVSKAGRAYELRHRKKTRDLLEAALDLADLAAASRAENASSDARGFRKAGMAGGRLEDRRRDRR